MGRPRKLPDGLRVRNGDYHADFYAGGRRVRKRLSGDLKVASQLLIELKARAERADFGLLDNDFPVAELRAEYERYARQALKPKTFRRYRACLDRILRGLAAARVTQLTVPVVLAYREDRLAEDYAPGTINLDVRVLGIMLRWGLRHGLIGGDPLAGLKPLPDDHAKEGRALSPAEVEALLAASPQPWRDVWYAYLVTGLRKDELACLTFADVDWDSREVIVRGGAAKNHRERRVPIEDGLWEILKRQLAGRAARRPGKGMGAKNTQQIAARLSHEHVFVSSANTPFDERSVPYVMFMTCCARAGIQTRTLDSQGRLTEHVDLHSLRRTFATNLIVNGADPKSVQELLGHRTLEMTMNIYARVHGGTKRQALGKLSYGKGVSAPEHVLPFPAKEGFPVPVGHQTVTAPESPAQVSGG